MGPYGGYFDPNAAAQYAKSAPALPPGWIKFSSQRGIVTFQGIGYFVVGVAMGVAGVALFMTNTVLVPYGIPIPGRGQIGMLFQVLEILICFAIGIMFFVFGILRVVRLSHLHDFFFLVTPDGFAQVSGDKVVGLPISDVTKVTRYNNRGSISLIIARRSGKILRLHGINDYGRWADITGAIVQAKKFARNAAIYVPQGPQMPYPPRQYNQYPPQQGYNQFPGGPYQGR